MHEIEFEDVRLRPGKIVCVGRNYADHARELDNPVPTEPVFFMKPASAIARDLIAPAAPARFEAELTYLWRGGKLAGLGLGLDLTLGALQQELKSKGLPWERAKAFRGSAVFSKFIAVDAVARPGLELQVNGATRQQGDLTGMIFAPDRLCAEIEAQFGLEDGDLIMTGTPSGVGDLLAGDRLVGRILDGGRVALEVTWASAHDY
jgi:2-keto-4-pentenoate hydratase/2-oxohepta-3-ene-1,7-dioic acid hydratase in catechol pathway